MNFLLGRKVNKLVKSLLLVVIFIFSFLVVQFVNTTPADPYCGCTLEEYNGEFVSSEKGKFETVCKQVGGLSIFMNPVTPGANIFMQCVNPKFDIVVKDKSECDKTSTAALDKVKKLIPSGTTASKLEDCKYVEINITNPAGGSTGGSSAGSGMTATSLLAEAKKKMNPGQLKSPQQLIGYAIKFDMAALGAIALGLYIWAGFLWMTSGGNSERRDKATKTLIWVTFGIIIMFASYLLIKFVFEQIIIK